MVSDSGFEVLVRGRIGRPQLRYFEPWTVQGMDGRTAILMPHADRPALTGLLGRLDDFALELIAVRTSSPSGRYGSQAEPRARRGGDQSAQ